MAEMKVTPWEVTGEVDYDKLRRDFGLDRIDQPLLDRMKKHTGELHYLLRRGIFYAHRDLGWLLDEYEKGNKFFLYTGRGPSGNTHLGHLIPWTFTKWLQDKFKTELWFQITDDEKFLFKDGMSLEDSHSYAIENALDIIALGFDPKRTKIFIDTDYSKTMYPHAVRVAKHITFSTAKAVFGFTNETNIGSIFYTSMQAVPAFLPSVMAKKNIPCLIPLAVDQDPHFRVARDVMPKLGYYKPAIMHSKFMPGLGPGGKMSASDPNSTIYTTDTPDVVKAKIQRAFTGQQPTKELQKKLGGNPDICSICQFYRFFFEQDDKKLEKIFESERDGSLLAGEHKADLTERANKFLAEHQKKREKARSQLDKFLLRD
jgi:tryptophanyl-tRNA synthetase